MNKTSTKLITFLTICLASSTASFGETVNLSNGNVALCWEKTTTGWRLKSLSAEGINADMAVHQHNILYSHEKPSSEALNPADFGGKENFPETQYRYVLPSWKEATGAVALNRAGEVTSFLPDKVEKVSENEIRMSYESPDFVLKETWHFDNMQDLCVTTTLEARRNGWYSIPTPSLCAVAPHNIDFALIPGVLHGHEINPEFSHAYAYGWGIPSQPVIYRERSTSTLSSILTSTAGLTIAVTAAPETAAGPWGYDKRNTGLWRLGLSAMNRQKEITPTLYHPVLGEDESYMKSGDKRTFSFRYTIAKDNWWPVFGHVVNDIYRFKDALHLRKNRLSLTDRLYSIHRYVVNDSTSKWHTVEFEGSTIGAQEYLGGVYKANKDAMKNADYGAMWMLGAMTSDSLLTSKRLPYALNFKLLQQSADSGFMKGASRGQYYLKDSRQFVEEWGPYTEPIATTYYMLMDLGNICLFEPHNNELKTLIRNAADCLMRWQASDGSWEVAYENETCKPAFSDLKDYRPTFYGLLIAYRILGDEKYLAAARRGADWLIRNAVDTDCWLGVCGDTRFAADFATIQAAQALLELFDLTGDTAYRNAAIHTARFYTTSVYTNPIASEKPCKVKGIERKDWEISQSGLSYEHGGIIGSTNLHGPILLASHAGMFVRMYGLTGDTLFLDMARAAAIGRDAFVDNATGVASYYWDAMNRGAGPYPHHAWWQMGWITDYLVSELELRSHGNISFPAGFITPKVGPHRTYAFRPGSVYGEKTSLIMRHGGAVCDNPNVEVILAKGEKNLFIMLLNDLDSSQKATVTTDPKVLENASAKNAYKRTLRPYGLEIIKIPYKK